MAGIILPPPEYCSLPRAAEILECDKRDLLHWAAIGLIEICIYLDYADAEVWLTGNNDNNPEVFERLKDRYGYIAPNSYIDTQESLDIGACSAKAKKEKQNKQGLWGMFTPAYPRYIKAFISGLWSISCITPSLEVKGHIEIPAYDEENIRGFAIRPADVAHFFITPFLLRNDIPFTLTADDLFITRRQIEKLLLESSLDNDNPQEQPSFHLENNRYAFFKNINNSLSQTHNQINNIINNTETHNHFHSTTEEKTEVELEEPEPLSKGDKITDSKAIKREQFLQAAIHVAFNSSYEKLFSQYNKSENNFTERWTSIIITHAKELFLTDRDISQSGSTIKNILDECLIDVSERKMPHNKKFIRRQTGEEGTPLI